MKASNGWHVYEYKQISVTSFLYYPDFYSDNYLKENFDINRKSLLYAQDAFTEHGWDGTGRVGIIWIPPFLLNTADSRGLIVWSVIQDRVPEEGIAYIASERDLSLYCDCYNLDHDKKIRESIVTKISNKLKQNIR